MLIIWLTILTLLICMNVYNVISDTIPIIGYEYNNNSLHLWNNGSIAQDWYYEADCLNQISNNLTEVWEKQQKGVLIDHPVHENEFDFELTGCEATDYTDNQTIVENNRSKRIEFVGNKHLDIKIDSVLELNDEMITQKHSFQPNFKVNQDIKYLLRYYNISIGGSKKDDYLITLNKSNNVTIYYNLTRIEELGMTYLLTQEDVISTIIIDDIVLGKSIKHNWSDEYNWTIKIDGNFSIYFHFGTFERNEIKTITKQWVDAGCLCFGLGRIRIESRALFTDGTNFSVDDSFSMGCNSTIIGSGACSAGCDQFYYTDQYINFGTTINTVANASDTFECYSGGTVCKRKVVVYGTPTWTTITCKKNNTHLLWCKHQNVAGWANYALNSQYVTCNPAPIVVPSVGFIRSRLWLFGTVFGLNDRPKWFWEE